MKLLLINTNTTRSITDLILTEARKVAAPDTELIAVTASFGGRYVASRATYAIAGHAALDAYARHGKDVDGVVLACFGDPGLYALKEVASQPVVGMAEAACLTAATVGRRFAIVTGGERWGPMLREFVALLGLSERLAAIQTVAPTGADIARNPEAALQLLEAACRDCVEQFGADAVILGGAGLAGLSTRLAPRVPVPLIDGLTAAVKMAEQLTNQDLGPAKRGASAAYASIETVGLSEPLCALLGTRSLT